MLGDPRFRLFGRAIMGQIIETGNILKGFTLPVEAGAVHISL